MKRGPGGTQYHGAELHWRVTMQPFIGGRGHLLFAAGNAVLRYQPTNLMAGSGRRVPVYVSRITSPLSQAE